MGIHTGEAEPEDGRYHGVAVHRGARIMAAAHGGQVLVSQTTSEMLGDEEAELDGITLRDLGLQRVKDLDRPVHLYQLVVEGLQSKFPPPRTLGRVHEHRRRLSLLAAALMGVVSAAIAIPIFALGSGGSGKAQAAVSASSVAVIDPSTGEVVDDVPVGTSPGPITAGAGGVWVADLNDNTVTHINPRTRMVVRAIPTKGAPTGLAMAAGAVWAASGSLDAGDVYRIDPHYDLVTARAHVPAGTFPGVRVVRAVAGRGKQLWVANWDATVVRIDPRTRKALRKVDDGGGFEPGVAIGSDGSIWVGTDTDNAVRRFDPRGALIATIPVGTGPTNLVVGAGAVWVANRLEDTVTRIDPATNSVDTNIRVGDHPLGIAVAHGAVWVANSRDGTIQKIDPAKNRVVRTLEVGNAPTGITFNHGLLWVTVAADPFSTSKGAATKGGIARFDVPAADFHGLDPGLGAGLGGTAQIAQATCARLFNYPDTKAKIGSPRIVPDVARSWPKASNGGKTYAFTIRPGFQFSPPSNAPVTAETFEYTYKRAVKLAPWLGSAPPIDVIKTSGSRLTIRLKRPDPILRAELATSPAFCAVPEDTPHQALNAFSSAGPYYVASYIPFRSVVLKRNPNYDGSRPQLLGEIRYALDVGERPSLADVEAGKADYIVGTCCNVVGIPTGDIPRLRARYGSRSAAAKGGRQQFFENPSGALFFVTLNTSRPLFANPRMRRAVNFAIDRIALANLGFAGWPPPFEPTDQYLPTTMPGFRDAHIYPLRPNVAEARRLAGPGRHRAVLYTCNVSPCPQQAEILKEDLSAIGIDLDVKQFDWIAVATKVRTKGEPFDLTPSFTSFGPLLDPSADLNAFLDSNVSTLDSNWARFDDPRYNRKLDATARLSGTARYRAYARLDADLARNAAPWAAWGLSLWPEFFSSRIGCQVYDPTSTGTDLAALCIRKE
jgi:YVTN family beta-propeller protein